jgi:hydroxyacylglutathione hydrolase
MQVREFTVGKFYSNCYLVSCEQTKDAIIIDPGFDDHMETQTLFKAIEANSQTLRFIVNTHGHPDHTCGNGLVKERFDVPILIHEYDAHMLGKLGRIAAEAFGFVSFSPQADKLLHDGDTIEFGETILTILHTPGHSRGGITLLGKKEVFTGDTLFAGSIGRTDFPESSGWDMNSSLKKLASLLDDFVVYPGHGPTTTIGEEKKSNPFLQWT